MHVFPNILNSQNVALKPNIVWVSDLFEFTVIIKDRKQKVGILLILDIPTNELLSINGFMKSYHRGSIKTKFVCIVFKTIIKERNIQNILIIHTDRAAEFTSKEFLYLINNK